MGGTSVSQLLNTIREIQNPVEGIAGVEAMQRRQLGEIRKMATYDAGGSLGSGGSPGLVDLAA